MAATCFETVQHLQSEKWDMSKLIIDVNSKEAAEAFDLATHLEEWDAIKYLICQGVDVNTLSGVETLIEAARCAKCDIIQCLIDHGFDMKSETGAEAFVEAAIHGHCDVMNCLMEHGLDVKTEIGARALIEAASCGHLEFVKSLIEQGVEVKSAAGSEAFAVAARLRQWDVMKCLIGYGAEVNSEAGGRALVEAASSGEIDFMKCLIDHGLELKSAAGAEAVCEAARAGQYDILEWLLQHNIEMKSHSTGLAMLHCAQNEQWHLVEAMIKLGVDVTSSSGRIALMYALRSEAWEIAKQFLEYGFELGELVVIAQGLVPSLGSPGDLSAAALQTDGSAGAQWQYEREDGWIDLGTEANSRMEDAYNSANPQELEHISCLSVPIPDQKSQTTDRKRKLRRIIKGHSCPVEWLRPISSIQVQKLLRARSHAASHEFPETTCADFSKVEIVSLRPVQSSPLWHKYESTARELRDKHKRFNIRVKFHELPPELRIHKLALSLNEGFYFHGTDQATAHKIAQFGFDERFSKGIYGDGLYFSPDACKAVQYAKPSDDGLRTLIIARVLVGDAFHATETRKGIRHAPQRPNSEPGLLYDSVVALPQKIPGAPGGVQRHTEVVIFNGAQTCPAYIVEFRMA